MVSVVLWSCAMYMYYGKVVLSEAEGRHRDGRGIEAIKRRQMAPFESALIPLSSRMLWYVLVSELWQLHTAG